MVKNTSSLIHQSVPDVLSLQLLVLDDVRHEITMYNFSMILVLLCISLLLHFCTVHSRLVYLLTMHDKFHKAERLLLAQILVYQV